MLAQLDQQVVLGDPGIGHQDIEPAHHLLGLRHQRLDLVLVGEVAGQHVDAILELACKLIEHVAPGAGDHHGRALSVERPRNRPADAAGRSGDERGLAGQIEHPSIP